MSASRTIGCEIIAALVKGPRTIGDITEMVDCSHVVVSYWMRDLQEAGLVRISGYIQLPYLNAKHQQQLGSPRAVYEWQTSPFALPSVTRDEVEAA